MAWRALSDPAKPAPPRAVSCLVWCGVVWMGSGAGIILVRSKDRIEMARVRRVCSLHRHTMASVRVVSNRCQQPIDNRRRDTMALDLPRPPTTSTCIHTKRGGDDRGRSTCTHTAIPSIIHTLDDARLSYSACRRRRSIAIADDACDVVIDAVQPGPIPFCVALNDP